MKISEIEKIKLEAAFRNGIAISLAFAGTFGLVFGALIEAIPGREIAYASVVSWLGAWLLHWRAGKVLERLDDE